MARLPTPGGDTGNWGEILNDYLSESHDASGTLKSDSVGSAQIQAGAIQSSHLDANILTPITNAKDAAEAAQAAAETAQADSVNAKTAAEAARSAAENAQTAAAQSAAAAAQSAQTGLVASEVPTTITAAMLGSWRNWTLSANYTLASLPTSGDFISRGGVITLTIKQAASGGPYAFTFPAIEWPNDANAPLMPTVANAELMIHLIWNGNAWRGVYAGVFYP